MAPIQRFERRESQPPRSEDGLDGTLKAPCQDFTADVINGVFKPEFGGTLGGLLHAGFNVCPAFKCEFGRMRLSQGANLQDRLRTG
jgi:hypothetical protein